MIKAGLLGLGFIGKVHYNSGYNLFKESSKPISLEAVFDINEENLNSIDVLRKYTDLDSFFEKEQGKLDFVDICLPTFMHKEIAIKAMEYGFNVLCEKPMALCYEDCIEMIKVSERTGKKLMIAHVLRFDDDYVTLKEYIEKEKLGKVKNVKYTYYREGLPQGQNNWFKNKKLSGGSSLDIHIHDADMIINLLGTPEIISTVSNSDDEFDGMNSFSTNMLFKNNVIANIQCDFSLKNLKYDLGRNIRVNFEKGYIIRNDEMFFAFDENGNETNLRLSRKEDYNENQMYYNEIVYFADCIAENLEFKKCSPYESSSAIKTVYLENKSALNKGKNLTF